MIIIFVEFINQLINYPINFASLKYHNIMFLRRNKTITDTFGLKKKKKRYLIWSYASQRNQHQSMPVFELYNNKVGVCVCVWGGGGGGGWGGGGEGDTYINKTVKKTIDFLQKRYYFLFWWKTEIAQSMYQGWKYLYWQIWCTTILSLLRPLRQIFW